MDLNDKAISENIGSFPRLQYSVNFGESYIFKCDHVISSNHSGVVFYGCVQQNSPNYVCPPLHAYWNWLSCSI